MLFDISSIDAADGDIGLVSKIYPLLDSPVTRHVGLEALFTVTRHGGIEARQTFAKEATPTLIRLMQELPDDFKANYLIVATLRHAVTVIVNEPNVDKKVLKSLDIPTILNLLLENMRKPEASYSLLTHAHDLLTSTFNYTSLSPRNQGQPCCCLASCQWSSDQ